MEDGGDNNNNNTNEDPPNPFSPEVLRAIQEANRLRGEAEENTRIAREELARSRNNNNNNNNNNISLAEGDVFNNPERLAARIKKDVEDTVQPLNNFMNEVKRKETYQLNLNRIKSTQPQIKIALDAGLQAYVDNAFITTEGLLPTEANIMAHINMFAGQVAISQIGNTNNINNNNNNNNANNNNRNNNENNNNNNNNRSNNSDMLPPHLQPSNRTRQNNNNEERFDESQFDENDRRLAREKNMTLKEWGLMKFCDPNDAGKVWKGILDARKKGGK